MPVWGHAVAIKQEAGRAGWCELWNAQDLHLGRMVLHHRLGHRAAQGAGDSGFLGGDDATRLPGGPHNRLRVQRLHRGHGDHSCRDPVIGELFCGNESPPQHRAIADQGHIVAIAKSHCPAGEEGVVLGIYLGHAHPTHPNEHRALDLSCPAHGGGGLDRVGWHHDRDVVDGAQPGDVFDRVMGRAEFAVRHSWAHAAQLHVAVGVRHVCFDLFQRSCGQEAGCRRHKGNAAPIGESGGHANHVLLGNADIDQPVRECPLEGIELAGADRVIDDTDDAMVLVRQLGKSFDVGIPAVVARPVGYRLPGG